MAINVEAPSPMPLSNWDYGECRGWCDRQYRKPLGLHPGPDHPIYVMSKAAISSLTKCLERDHTHQKSGQTHRPNEVNTSMWRTGLTFVGLTQIKLEELSASVPLGRIAEPEDIADVVTFLASEEAQYICGALVEVNGGKPVA